MAKLTEILAHADALLKVDEFQDYCPNGLQVEGRAEVKRIVAGVTASQALVERAVELGADLLLVHHGWFWKGEDPRLVGIKGRRVRTLVEAGISLVAYHLPLDAHPELGNNALLGRLLGLEVTGEGPGVGLHGRLVAPLSAAGFAARVAGRLGREPLLIEGGDHPIERIAWCSGAAHSYLEQAAALGVDAYLSGEINEPTVHLARELGVHYLAAGHHATECEGVRALAENLAQRFDLEQVFVDIPNPV
jgi:dinuclear metal center YbgI/SA1388 family protein